MNSLTGTGALVRMALRRDRIRLPAWIVTVSSLVLLVAVTIGDLYPTAQARQQLATTVGANPALRAVLGPVFEGSTVGGLVAWRMSFASLVLVPLMALLAVVRHTRAEEESGRLELLGSTVLGRRAPLAAALLVAWGASTVLGACVAAVMIGYGEAVVASLALGLSYALAGCVFASVAAVCAQVTENARTASGIAIGVMAVAFLLRSVGSAADLGWARWASPLGWVLEIRPYAAERWWVAGLLAGLAALLAVVAERLTVRRDLEAGLVPPRAGPAEAVSWLRGPLGLAWRLHRAALLGWAMGLFALGAMYGGVAANVGQLLDTAPQFEEIFRLIGGEQALVDAYFATTMTIAGFVTAGFVVYTVLRLRAEETGLRAEYVLATAVRRTPWALSHVAVAAGGAVILLAAMGLGAAVTHGPRVGDIGGEVSRLVPAALVQLPAVLVLAGLALALVGILPRATALVWAALVAFLVIGQLGALLQLDQWVMDLSPFSHLPSLPGGDVTALPLAVLVGVSAALGAAGLAGLRVRDISG